MFTQKEIDLILNNKLNKDFFEIALKQQIKDKPTIFKGTGTIYQNKEGEIQLKLFCTNKNTIKNQYKNLFTTQKDIKPGKLIPRHYFYSLIIKDDFKTWTAKNIWISNGLQLSMNGCLIETKINKLIIKENKINQTDPSTHFIAYVSGKLDLPNNKIKSTEEIHSLCITELNINKHKFEIEQKNNYLEISASLNKKGKHDKLINIFFEALSISQGRLATPTLLLTSEIKTRTAIIYHQNKTLQNRKIAQPLPPSMPYQTEDLNIFIEKYLTSIKNPLSSIYGHWYRILSESNNFIENQALTLTTAIEGLLKEYYDNLGLPDKEFLEQITEAKKFINNPTINLKARVIDRITASLNLASSFSPKQALISLNESNFVSKIHLKNWTHLRNKSHHAGLLKQNFEAIEKYHTDILTCLELFYILILRHIKYAGNFTQYSLDNWPSGYFDPEKGILINQNKTT